MGKKGAPHERVLVSLPRTTAAKLTKYAKACREGNKSGFVADAIEAYISNLHSQRRTQKLRESYAASAEHARRVAEDWQALDEDAWARLDQLEQEAKKNHG
ncbi:MAG: hypothetical protein ACQESR_06255 [Planctomycetota bacterium]